MRGSDGEAFLALAFGQGFAGSWIDGAFGSVWCAADAGGFLDDFAAGAEAGVDHFAGQELCERGFVGVGSGGLEEWFAIPSEAQPAEVVLDAGEVFRAGAGGIDVLMAEEECAAAFPCQVVCDFRGEGVAEVESAGGAGREAGDGWRRHGAGGVFVRGWAVASFVKFPFAPFRILTRVAALQAI